MEGWASYVRHGWMDRWAACVRAYVAHGWMDGQPVLGMDGCMGTFVWKSTIH